MSNAPAPCPVSRLKHPFALTVLTTTSQGEANPARGQSQHSGEGIQPASRRCGRVRSPPSPPSLPASPSVAVPHPCPTPLPGQHKPLPSELRPPRVLLNTIQHLVVHVAGVAMEGGVPGRLSQDYAFLADRFRWAAQRAMAAATSKPPPPTPFSKLHSHAPLSSCIRQDLAIQAAQGGDAIRVLEAHARFLAFAGYHLHRASADAFSAVLNRQQLKQTLLSLQSLYRLNGASACCRNEPMYQALLLVSFFDHPEVMETAFRLPASVVDSVPMRQARRLCVALRENRYAALVRLARCVEEGKGRRGRGRLLVWTGWRFPRPYTAASSFAGKRPCFWRAA